MFEIYGKIRTLIISILILSFLIVSLHVGPIATDTDGHLNNTVNVNSRDFDTRSGVSDWGSIDVLSEPAYVKNLNTELSGWSKVAVEGNKIYVVWHDLNDTNGASTSSPDIFYKHYNGNSWSEVQVISEPVPGQDNFGGVAPSLAVENGKVYVVWDCSQDLFGAGTDSDIFFRCNLTGTSWEPIQVLSEPVVGQNINTDFSDFPDISVENGKIYVVWEDDNDTNGAGIESDIFYRANLTGSSWEPVQVISEPKIGYNIDTSGSNRPKIDVENGKIYSVWYSANNTNSAGGDYDIFYLTNLTGSSWEPVQVISEPIEGLNVNTGSSFVPRIAVENGKGFVVWYDQDPMSGSGTDYDIFYRCNLTGSGWEDIQIISEPVNGQNTNTGDSDRPSIDVKNGKIHVVWADWNDTNGAGTDTDVFYRANLTGSSWEPVQVISEPVEGKDHNSYSTDFNCHPDIAVESNSLHAVWTDENNSISSGNDHDIFIRQRIPQELSLSLGKVRPIIGNTSTYFNYTVKYTQTMNLAPTSIKVKINGIEHSMLDADQLDTNYKNGKYYYFDITNLDIGQHTFVFNASDGINFTNSIQFSNPKVFNTIPKIMTEDNLTAIEDEYYEIVYEFEDIDFVNVGQACRWEFATNASWLKFDLITGKLYGTPSDEDVGQYWINIAINDTMDVVDTNFTLTVLDVNYDPIITTKNVEVTNEDELYHVHYKATDIDSAFEDQHWSFETNATSWLGINSSSGILNGTPGNDDVGEYWINVTVNDNDGGYDYTNFTLLVLNVNDPPIIITEDIGHIRLGEFCFVDYEAIDIDSDLLNQLWSFESNASWLNFNLTTGVLNGTPQFDDVGLYRVNVSINDGDGGSAWHEFQLVVLNRVKNNPPIITTIAIELAKVNKLYSMDYNATDDHTPLEQLYWYLKTNASWLRIDLYTGVLSGTPGDDDTGEYWVNITVSDRETGRTFQYFLLRVIREPVFKNKAPKLSHITMSPKNGDTGTEFTFTVHYFDADNDFPEMICIVIDGNTYDMILISGEIIFNGKYEYKTKLPEGNHTYYFTASDGLENITTETFTTLNIGSEKNPGETSINTQIIIITVSFVSLISIITAFIGGTEAGKYKFLSLIFVPLYNKLHPDKIFDNYLRGKIHGYIEARPGEHYNAIKSALKLKNGTLTHHTKVLAKEGLISIKRDGFFTRFYPIGIQTRGSEMPAMMQTQEEIIDIIRHEPGITQHKIMTYIDLSQSATSYNLTWLKRNNLVKCIRQGREKRYYFNDKRLVSEVLEERPRGKYPGQPEQSEPEYERDHEVSY